MKPKIHRGVVLMLAGMTVLSGVAWAAVISQGDTTADDTNADSAAVCAENADTNQTERSAERTTLTGPQRRQFYGECKDTNTTAVCP